MRNAECGMKRVDARRFVTVSSMLCRREVCLINLQSAIRNPQSAIRNPQSAIRNPQSIRVPIDTDHPDERRRDDGRHSQEFPILLTK